MRLEKVVLNGFKSFADKTEFVFDSPVTAIVGPNGCGKSNVVDAVKWVLGEQRVKSLRSDQMADVIFSGSTSRKPAGSAEVSLFISNNSGRLAIDTDLVQITRRIYKSGESEYSMNNKVCRLKDIRELFMDTGVGVRAYSIIEQGQIEQVLNASKTDRRVIFEEAAGISKYKAHKKEALAKLERTEQNLLRLADILSEVGKQLRSIKLQATKARNYLQCCQRLKELRVNYSLAEFDKINVAQTEKRAALEQFERQLASIIAEVAKSDASLGYLRQRIIETENDISYSGNSLVSVQSKIDQSLQKIEFLRTRTTELQRRKQNTVDMAAGLQQQENRLKADLAQYENEQADCQKLLMEKEQHMRESLEKIEGINKECTLLQTELEDEKSGIIDIVRRTAQLHNELQSITVYRSGLSSQKDRLSDKVQGSQAELEKLLVEKAQHQARQNDIESLLSELAKNLESERAKTEEINALIEEDNKRLVASKETRSALVGEQVVLADMEARLEGINSAVKSILQSKAAGNGEFCYVDGMLADVITADIEYSNAVEAALEGKTDTLITNDASALLADTQRLEKLHGRVSFLCTDKIEPFVDKSDLSGFNHIKGRIVEFIKYDGRYAPLVWSLLGKTIVVDSIEAASELADKLPKQYEFVTLKGEALGADGTIKLGSLGKATGLISRRSRLRQLERAIANISEEITAIEKRIDENTQQGIHLAKLCQELRTAVYEANTEKMQVASKLTIYEQNIERLRKEQPLIAGEIDSLENEIAQSVKKEYESKQKLQELQTVNSERTEHIKELETNLTEKKTQQQGLSDKLTDLRVALGRIAEQGKSLKQTIANVQNQINVSRTAADTARMEIQTCSEQLTQTARDILDCESAVSQLFLEKEKHQRDNQLLAEKIEKLLEEQKQAEQLIRQKRTEQADIEQRINQLKIELGQLEVKSQDLIERVRDELQMDLRQACENYTPTSINWDEVKEEIAQLRGKIERLGSVNIEAIESQENLLKRQEFLNSQVEDLNSSKAQLQQLINRLNKMSREKFVQTFEEIRLHFQQLFRKLFGGGKADIVLEEAEDILEAPIEIIARPPGKETRSISLLSGGEKSMTAIALLFAIFKAKPSPFCFLDEVDAALDEANNERFNMLIREFQKDSQFIVITHAKRTMSIADVLFGITMQTRGVSKKISVRFDQFDQIEEETTAVA
jgi:chromosome segregation protein